MNAMADITLNPDDIARLVMLTYGRMEDGKSTYWCYVAVKPSEYSRFQQVLKAGKLDLHRFDEDGFGEVVISGPGLYPPSEVTREVARAFRVPLKELFNGAEPETAVARKIAQLKEQLDTKDNTGASS